MRMLTEKEAPALKSKGTKFKFCLEKRFWSDKKKTELFISDFHELSQVFYLIPNKHVDGLTFGHSREFQPGNDPKHIKTGKKASGMTPNNLDGNVFTVLKSQTVAVNWLLLMSATISEKRGLTCWQKYSKNVLMKTKTYVVSQQVAGDAIGQLIAGRLQGWAKSDSLFICFWQKQKWSLKNDWEMLNENHFWFNYWLLPCDVVLFRNLPNPPWWTSKQPTSTLTSSLMSLLFSAWSTAQTVVFFPLSPRTENDNG